MIHATSQLSALRKGGLLCLALEEHLYNKCLRHCLYLVLSSQLQALPVSLILEGSAFLYADLALQEPVDDYPASVHITKQCHFLWQANTTVC